MSERKRGRVRERKAHKMRTEGAVCRRPPEDC